MPRWVNVLVLSAALALGALAAGESNLAPLPTLTIGDFVTEVQDQVQKAYDAARERPRDAQAAGELGMLLDLYNRPDQAIACYQRARQFDPRSLAWAYYLGSLLARVGRHADAAPVLRSALHLKPDYLPARLKLAESLFDAGEVDASQREYAAILSQSPDAAEAHYGLGRIAAARGDTAAARQAFLKACELFPTYGAAHYALAQLDRKLGNTAEATKELALYAPNKGVVPPVDDPLRDELRKLDRKAAAHLERGVRLEQVGRTEDAIAETEEALRLDPGLVKAHINLLILYGRAGNLPKAEEHYQAAIKLNPTQFPDAYYNYGVLLMKHGKFDEAEKTFRTTIEIAPGYANAHLNLGTLLERQGKLPEAAAEYRKEIASNQASRPAHFKLGRILVNQRQYQEAIEQFRQILTPVDEQTPAYLYALGAAYGRAGDDTHALDYLTQAREQAAARGQTALVSEIEKDLAAVRQPPHATAP